MGNILDVIERDFYTISKDEKTPYNEHWISLATVKIKWHFPNKENNTGLLNSLTTVNPLMSVLFNI